MSRRRYQRPACWGLAIGVPGKAPSRQARQLAASPTAHALPNEGLWHVADYTAPILATHAPVVTEAIHMATGEPFMLATVAGDIVAVAPQSDRARDMVVAAWRDPIDWARHQAWRIDQPGAGLQGKEV